MQTLKDYFSERLAVGCKFACLHLTLLVFFVYCVGMIDTVFFYVYLVMRCFCFWVVDCGFYLFFFGEFCIRLGIWLVAYF